LQGAVQVKERGERVIHALESIGERLTAIEDRLGALEKATSKSTAPGSRPVRSPRSAAAKTKTSS
jgi:hypothetical protein